MFVYKYEKNKFDKPFLSFKPNYVFIGRSKVCDMTEFSQAEDKYSFDGNTLLQECEDNEHVYIPGLEISKFMTNYIFIDYISLMGNNLIPYAFVLAEKHTYFLNNRYNFVENDKIEESFFLNATNATLDPFDYHLEKCGEDSFEKREHRLIHTCWPGLG